MSVQAHAAQISLLRELLTETQRTNAIQAQNLQNTQTLLLSSSDLRATGRLPTMPNAMATTSGAQTDALPPPTPPQPGQARVFWESFWGILFVFFSDFGSRSLRRRIRCKV